MVPMNAYVLILNFRKHQRRRVEVRQRHVQGRQATRWTVHARYAALRSVDLHTARAFATVSPEYRRFILKTNQLHTH